jgi:hypothetical protein
MMALGIELQLPAGEFTLSPVSATHPFASQFPQLNFAALLEKEGIDENSLQSVETLPSLQTALRKLVDAGKANSVIDLGWTCATQLVYRPHQLILDLGRS